MTKATIWDVVIAELARLEAQGKDDNRDSWMGNAIKAVNRLEAHCAKYNAYTPAESLYVPGGSWISVKDRLPPADQDVLFWEPRGVGYGFKARDDSDSLQWFDKTATDRDGDYQDTYEVTHWMPLPAAPAISDGGPKP